MAQVKKDDIRARILSAAEDLFSTQPYAETTMTAIAKAAGISKSNIYVYYGSKLEILWAICDPWLRDRFERLQTEMNRIEHPRDRLRHLFMTLWCDLPADRNGFANNMMQALSTAADAEGYSLELLTFCKKRFAALLTDSLPEIPVDPVILSHIAFMAFDGFAIAQRLGTPNSEAVDSANVFADLLSR